jgi:hypothetical protein
MRSTFDLPNDLTQRAKITAVRRGSALRDQVANESARGLELPACARERRSSRSDSLWRMTVWLLSRGHFAAAEHTEHLEVIQVLQQGRLLDSTS